MGTLQELASQPESRATLIEEIVQLIDREVAAKRGPTGFAIKAGYKVVSKLRGGRMIPKGVDILLDDFSAALDPYVEEYGAREARGFADFLTGNDRRVAQSLLEVADARVRDTRPVIQNTYGKLRPMATKQVQDAVPAVGKLIERYLARA